MYRLINSIGLLLLMISGVWAQESMDFNRINTETYRLFLAGEWDSVITIWKIAEKQDVDFYYLRMRVGIAHYNQQRYRQASAHFKRALELSHADPGALEYLYYSLLFSGQADRAALVRKDFKGDLALKLPPEKGKFLDRFGVEYLYNRGLNKELLSNPDVLFSDLPLRVQYLTRSYSNASISLSNSVVPGIRLNHAYTYLTKTSFMYYNDGFYDFQMEDQHVYQHQYYFSPSLTTSSGFTFEPAFHLLSINFEAPLDANQGYQGGSAQPTIGYKHDLESVSGLSISLSVGNLDLHLGGWYATLNRRRQVQNRLGFTWYPSGNLDLYLGAHLNSQYEISDSADIIRFVPEVHAGLSIAGKLWVTVNTSIGDMKNYLEQNGAIVYNSFSDVIQTKAGLTLSVPVTEKGSLIYLGGRWTMHESRSYDFGRTLNEITNPISYHSLAIYGGISWKF